MPLSSVDVLRVPREPIKQQEDVSAACNPMTDPRSLLQQAFLPHQLPTADARVQILRLLINQVGFSKQVCHACARAARSEGGSGDDARSRTIRTWSAVAPVHQLVLPLNDGSQLRRPVAVLLLVHEEIHALPHQVLLGAAEHVLVAQQHLQHR